jgi:hypothetical protein
MMRRGGFGIKGRSAFEKLIIAKVEEWLRPDKTCMGPYFSESEMDFVWP